MARLAFFVLALCAVASARMAYQFYDGAEQDLKEKSYTESFSCENLPYGYYADTDNHCQIFHICLPVTNGRGELVEIAHFSFVCPNLTIFNQQTLACTSEDEAPDCLNAVSLYELSNSEFGVVLDPEEDS